jgi:NADH dehydrogenase FAD-containing subunit
LTWLISLKDHLRVAGTDGTIFAVGDCTSTQYAPTAQVASQQGAYLARMLKQLAKRDALLEQITTLEKEGTNTESLQKQLTAKVTKLRPFHYSHQGSLAYIGSEKAIADLEFFHHKVRLAFGHGDSILTNLTVFLRRRCDIPVLAECLPEHAFLPAESRFGRY